MPDPELPRPDLAGGEATEARRRDGAAATGGSRRTSQERRRGLQRPGEGRGLHGKPALRSGKGRNVTSREALPKN